MGEQILNLSSVSSYSELQYKSLRSLSKTLIKNSSEYYSSHLLELEEKGIFLNASNKGYFGVANPQFLLQFFAFHWGSSPFLACQHYTYRLTGNMSLKSHEHKYSRYFSYITLGLLFILSPVVGIIYGMGTLFWVALNYKQRLLQELLLAGLISTGTIISIIQVFCSFSTLEWIHNVFFVGNGSIIPIDWWRLKTIGFSLSTPAWNFFIIAIVFLVLRTLWQRKLFIVFTIWLILSYYLLAKVQVYGYVGLFPLLLLMTVGKNQGCNTKYPAYQLPD